MCRHFPWLAFMSFILAMLVGVLFTDEARAQKSPDRKLTASLRADGAGVWQLYVKSAATSSVRQMTFFGTDNLWETTRQGVLACSWSPDSKRLALLVHHTSCMNTVRSLEEGYNETTLMVLNVGDLATTYLGGVDPRYSTCMIDLSDVGWADAGTVRFRYRMCEERVSSGVKTRRIAEGQMLRAGEDFFGRQTVAHWLAKMIAARTPVFSGGCPAGSRRITASLIADPTLWIMDVWKLGDWDKDLGYAVQVRGKGYQGDYFVLKEGRIMDFISPG